MPTSASCGWSSGLTIAGVASAAHSPVVGSSRAIRLGLRKLTVEVVADKEGDIEMFSTIGFEAEALLKNQIMDRTGELRDLVVLAHDIDEVRDDLELIGLDDALGLGGTL